MDPRIAVAEYLSLDRESFRRGIGAMEKSVETPDARSGDFEKLMEANFGSEITRGLETCLQSEFMVQVVGLKRKRDDFEIDSSSVDLEDESIAKRKHARSLVEERTVPTAPANCKMDLELDSDSHGDDDCVITGFVMPQLTLPSAPADRRIVLNQVSKSDNDDDSCVIVGCKMPQSTLASARACGNVALTCDSDAAEADDDCLITGWLTPRAILINDSGAEYEFRDSGFVDELRASEADDDEFSDSEYSVKSIPASVSARESDDGFNASESDDGFSGWGSDEEFSPVPEWNADDAILWGWFDARR